MNLVRYTAIFVLLMVALRGQVQPDRFDSGWIDHVGALPAVVATHTAQVPNARWLRVRLGDCHLPAGSLLRLEGLRDQAVQFFAAGSLADYQFTSAFFNGDRVRIDLVAAPGSKGNRLAVSSLLYEGGGGEDVGICGPVDTRVLSQDPRVGRLGGCCTMFLVNEFALATAGHCLSGTAGIVSFEVPLSDANGNPQYPPPEHQYAFAQGSATSVNGGLGNDWCVVGAVRNSNTGLYPGQAQGWFPWGAPPAFAGQTVAVTGYGSHANPTWSLAQKTHSGPRTGASTAVLEFSVHVSGCNSGSPVIDLGAQRAIGITTHAGCTATGGSNYGTGFGLTALRTALANLVMSRVAGSATAFGQGCGGAFGTPALGFAGIPDVGQALTIEVAGLNPTTSEFGTLVFGFSSTAWSGGSLPAPLAPYGLVGCTLYTSSDAAVFLPTNFGSTSYVQQLPNHPSFVAMPIHCQYFALDASAQNPVGGVASNAGRIRIGN